MPTSTIDHPGFTGGPHDFSRTHDRAAGRGPLAAARSVRSDRRVPGAALAAIATHRIDDADLYFQYTRSEGWSLEEGIVKSGSFGIDQGVGVRAVAGEKTAFAYSDDISEAALIDAAETVRTIAASGQSRSVKRAAADGGRQPRALRADGSDRDARQHAEGRAAREGREARAREGSAHRPGDGGLAGEYDVVLIARADGTMAADVRPLVRLSVSVIAEQTSTARSGASPATAAAAAASASATSRTT
jgi:TldD protein